MSALRDRLQQSLGGRPGARLIPGSAGGELEIEVTASDLATAASTLAAERGVLLASYADDEGPGADGAGGGLRLRHIFAVEGDPGLVTVTATLDGKRPEAPSLTPMNPGAAWAEREMHDLFGIEFLGHPEPRPLLFSDARPEALPMRRDLARRELLRERVPDRGHLVTVEGEGVHALDLDFAGSTAPTESARARVSVHGERVVHVEPLLFRKHRGVEKGCEGRRPAAAVALAERACGRDAVANAAGMALALERLAGVRAPRRAAWLTTALLEIERIASHALALAAVVEACGSEACEMRLRRGHEAIRNALEAAFGSRLGLGVVAPGGVRRDLDAAAARALVKAVGQSAAELRAAVESALADRAFVDRLEGTGVAPPDLVAELGAQGPVARPRIPPWRSHSVPRSTCSTISRWTTRARCATSTSAASSMR